MAAPSYTYDPALSQDKDWVRFLSGDRTTGSMQLSDQELLALIAGERSNGKSGNESSQVYFAAATVVQTLFATWASSGSQNITETQIGGLRLKRGSVDAAREAINDRVKALRARGAVLLSPTPTAFRVL